MAPGLATGALRDAFAYPCNAYAGRPGIHAACPFGVDLVSLETITGQVGSEYIQVIHDTPGEVIIGVMLDAELPVNQLREIPASPVTPQILGKLLLAVKHDVKPDVFSITPKNGLGDPPIDTVFSSYGIDASTANMRFGVNTRNAKNNAIATCFRSILDPEAEWRIRMYMIIGMNIKAKIPIAK